MIAKVINFPLKAGYIFIPCEGVTCEELPSSYIASRCGSFGYFAKLDDKMINGYSPVPVCEYENA